jgi:6-phosphogluconolactonase (cycloisomerase 2 family)
MATTVGDFFIDRLHSFLALDRTGRYMLSAYYQGGYVAVYPIAADGTIGAAATDNQKTAVGAHAIATDPSNRFAFVPPMCWSRRKIIPAPT